MPSGGARPRSGPPPDPEALRRDRPSDSAGFTFLPFEGRQGPAPIWPLIGFTVREEELWLSMWRKPQAIMWERLGQEIEVALFVRKLAEAELPKASVELQKVVRQYLDSLGLSVGGMLRNRWKLTEPVSEEDSAAPVVPKKSSARDRLKVVGKD